MDAKIDDGLPQTGNVLARFVGSNPSTFAFWSAKNSSTGNPTSRTFVPYTTATPALSTTCYDNGNVAGTQKYSVGTNGGNGLNCALSFRFQ